MWQKSRTSAVGAIISFHNRDLHKCDLSDNKFIRYIWLYLGEVFMLKNPLTTGSTYRNGILCGLQNTAHQPLVPGPSDFCWHRKNRGWASIHCLEAHAGLMFHMLCNLGIYIQSTQFTKSRNLDAYKILLIWIFWPDVGVLNSRPYFNSGIYELGTFQCAVLYF